MPNVRAKRGTDGGTPGPGYRKCTPYLWPGPGGPPLVLRLSEGLGLSAAGSLSFKVNVPIKRDSYAIGKRDPA